MPWLSPEITELPAVEPITAAEAKAQMAVDGNDFDALLAIYIKAARQLVEAYTGQRLVTQTAVLRASSFADLVRLPTAPIASVSAVTYLDVAGDEQLLDPAVYEAILVGLEPHLRLKVGQSWPSVRPVSDAVRIEALCGYGAGADVPETIRQAMLVTVAAFMADREGGDMPKAAMNLLENERLFA